MTSTGNTLRPCWARFGSQSRKRPGSSAPNSHRLSWALARRFIDSDPTDHVKALLGKQPRSKGKFRALPYRETSEALEAIEGCEAGEAAKLFVRFAILTATRSGESRLALWPEIEF